MAGAWPAPSRSVRLVPRHDVDAGPSAAALNETRHTYEQGRASVMGTALCVRALCARGKKFRTPLTGALVSA